MKKLLFILLGFFFFSYAVEAKIYWLPDYQFENVKIENYFDDNSRVNKDESTRNMNCEDFGYFSSPKGSGYNCSKTYSIHKLCYACTAKPCPSGYTAGLLSCLEKTGYNAAHSSSGYSGDQKCGKCEYTVKSCPNTEKTEKVCYAQENGKEGWNWVKSNNFSGEEACGQCVAKSCPAGYSAGIKNCDGSNYGDGYVHDSNGYSGADICGRCVVKKCNEGVIQSDCEFMSWVPNGYLSGKSACGTCSEIIYVSTKDELLAAVDTGKKGTIVLTKDIDMGTQVITLHENQNLAGIQYVDSSKPQTRLILNASTASEYRVINLSNSSVIRDINITLVGRNAAAAAYAIGGGTVSGKVNIKLFYATVGVHSSTISEDAVVNIDAYYGYSRGIYNTTVNGTTNIRVTDGLYGIRDSFIDGKANIIVSGANVQAISEATNSAKLTEIGGNALVKIYSSNGAVPLYMAQVDSGAEIWLNNGANMDKYDVTKNVSLADAASLKAYKTGSPSLSSDFRFETEKEIFYVNGVAYVSTKNELLDAIDAGKNIVLTNDIDMGDQQIILNDTQCIVGEGFLDDTKTQTKLTFNFNGDSSSGIIAGNSSIVSCLNIDMNGVSGLNGVKIENKKYVSVRDINVSLDQNVDLKSGIYASGSSYEISGLINLKIANGSPSGGRNHGIYNGSSTLNVDYNSVVNIKGLVGAHCRGIYNVINSSITALSGAIVNFEGTGVSAWGLENHIESKFYLKSGAKLNIKTDEAQCITNNNWAGEGNNLLYFESGSEVNLYSSNINYVISNVQPSGKTNIVSFGDNVKISSYSLGGQGIWQTNSSYECKINYISGWNFDRIAEFTKLSSVSNQPISIDE